MRGLIVALTTPFKKDLSVDYEALKKHVKYLEVNNVNGYLLLGTTAESEALTISEEVKICKCVLDVIKNPSKIIISLIGNTYEKVMMKYNALKDLDAYAYLVITPFYNKTNNVGLSNYFKTISRNVNKPVIIYNIPKRTGLSVPFEVLKELKNEPNIIGIKEASGDISYQVKVASIVDENFIMYAGDDLLLLPSLSLGASGIISVYGNAFPCQIIKVLNEFYAGNIIRAKELFYQEYKLIMLCFFEVSPIGIKFMLYKMGLMDKYYRSPLCYPSAELIMKIDKLGLDKI